MRGIEMTEKYISGSLLMGTLMGIVAGIGVGLIAGVVLKYIYDSYLQERPMRKELKYIIRKAFKRSNKCLIM
jgi:NhaP-type Na+/H+ or K+/H+ antiporter